MTTLREEFEALMRDRGYYERELRRCTKSPDEYSNTDIQWTYEIWRAGRLQGLGEAKAECRKRQDAHQELCISWIKAGNQEDADKSHDRFIEASICETAIDQLKDRT